jgi:hypothetical protein
MGCGCLLAPLKYLWAFLRWCFTSGWKGVIVLIVVAVIVVVIGVSINNAVTKKSATPTATVPASVASVPSKFQAPYIVQTPSRYYYAKVVVQKNGVTTMTGFWSLDGKQWVPHTETLVMGKEYGKVTVSKR